MYSDQNQSQAGVSGAAVINDQHESPPWNFSWVVKGELCGSAWPDTLAQITFLKNEGVGHIVSLSEERQPPCDSCALVKCHLIPVEEFEPPSNEDIVKFIDVCKVAKLENKAVLVHCRMGRGRTGVMLACFLVRFYKQHPDQAMMNVRLMRPGSVETWAQERAVRTYWDYLAWGHV